MANYKIRGKVQYSFEIITTTEMSNIDNAIEDELDFCHIDMSSQKIEITDAEEL